MINTLLFTNNNNKITINRVFAFTINNKINNNNTINCALQKKQNNKIFFFFNDANDSNTNTNFSLNI